MATPKLISLLFMQLILALCVSSSGAVSNPSKSLEIGFYKRTCPDAESIVDQVIYDYVSQNPDLAAPLLRLHFHDCFVRGCDASVLLNSTSNNTAEKDAAPNSSLDGFAVIDAVKAALERKCPDVVSCADILALVARDVVKTIGGPFWPVPTGRRDGTISRASEALANMPPADGDITLLKAIFASKGLSVKDLVILSGAHTIGRSHCTSFSNRLYNFTGKGDTDPSLDKNYIPYLKKACKPGDTTTTVEMDPGSFTTFDKHYYVLVGKRRGLFHSDAALLNDPETRSYVERQNQYPGSSFGIDFGPSMVNMGKVELLTGKEGEIRKHCALAN